jgi:hypothetical protein
VATAASVIVDIQGDTLVPDSVRLHHRADGGAFDSILMQHAGGGLYQASLPAFSCDDSPEFYFSAEGEQIGVVYLPEFGPVGAHAAFVGDLATTVFDMETTAGWVGGAPGDTATLGLWERGVPQGTSAQADEDHTPAPGDNCWVTGRLAGTGVGSFDVDGGFTTLLSPILDLSDATDATRIGYWRWYSNSAGATPNSDVFTISLSSDGGANWSVIETVGPAGPQTAGGWFYHEFRVADILPLTGSMQMRFVASDFGSGSIVEAAVDDVVIYAVACSDACAADFDQNGVHEVPDTFAFLSAWFAQDPSAEFDGASGITVPDIFAFVSIWFAGC